MNSNKKEEIYRKLQERIIKHEIPAGTKLNEKELMEEYNIGRTPLRSIITKLTSEYLLEVIPQSGTYVKTINLNELKDVLEIRLPLEHLAAKMISIRITSEQLEKINYILYTLRKNIDVFNLNEVKNYTDQIHNLYYQATGNERLTKSLIELHNFSSRAWYENNKIKKHTKNDLKEWENIIKAIENNKVEELQTLIKEHILSFASSLGLECLQN